VISGIRPLRPPADGCSDQLWELIEQCWAHVAGTRPLARDVSSRIRQLSGLPESSDSYLRRHSLGHPHNRDSAYRNVEVTGGTSTPIADDATSQATESVSSLQSAVLPFDTSPDGVKMFKSLLQDETPRSQSRLGAAAPSLKTFQLRRRRSSVRKWVWKHLVDESVRATMSTAECRRQS
jgi:hypothetical protein